MTPAIVEFAISAAVIIVAGTFLSRFADEIADRTGLGRLLIGSILLAGATSLPELSVDISAIRSGLPDLAVGDLMGSSLFNLAILAMLDLSSRSRGQMLSRRAARHALSGNVSAALTAVVGVGLLAQPVTGAGEILGISYGIVPVILGYLFGVRLVYLDQRVSREDAAAVGAVEGENATGSWLKPAVGFVIAAAFIVVAGPYLAEAAGEIAEATGLGESFVGATLVAFSTSLPELVTSFAALRMGAHDLAVGNVFGSNVFNMLLLVPLDVVHAGPLLGAVSVNHSVTCIAAVVGTLVVVLGQLYQVEDRRRVIEPDAWLVLTVIVASLWLVYKLG